MVRYKTIDVFRGLAILGMVFFTIPLRLSRNLPDILQHNVWGTIHLGDFVLPMFLFASGLSLAFFIEKYNKEKKKRFRKKAISRFATLALIGISLSVFSAYGFLEMDEVMLSALLFIACVLLSRFNWKINILIIFLINLSYFVIIFYDFENIFIGHYLGGYPAALFYLPIMLSGLVIGRGIIKNHLWCKNNKIIITMIFLFFILFYTFIPLNKMTATPSFIMLSILFSFFVFIIVELFTSKILISKKLMFIGKKPIIYWLLMYIIFIIPLWFYVEFSNQSIPLNLHWSISLLFSLSLIIIFYYSLKFIEHLYPVKNTK